MHQMIIPKGTFVPETLVRLLVVTVLFQVAWSSPPSAIDQSFSFLSQLTDSRLTGGTVAVQKAGKIVYSKGFGYADEVWYLCSSSLNFLPDLRKGCGCLLHIVSCMAKES